MPRICGAVYVGTDSTFIMNGGKLGGRPDVSTNKPDNMAQKAGSAVYIAPSSVGSQGNYQGGVLTVACANDCGITFDVTLTADNDACTGEGYVYEKASVDRLEDLNGLLGSAFTDDDINYFTATEAGEADELLPGAPTEAGSIFNRSQTYAQAGAIPGL